MTQKVLNAPIRVSGMKIIHSANLIDTCRIVELQIIRVEFLPAILGSYIMTYVENHWVQSDGKTSTLRNETSKQITI